MRDAATSARCASVSVARSSSVRSRAGTPGRNSRRSCPSSPSTIPTYLYRTVMFIPPVALRRRREGVIHQHAQREGRGDVFHVIQCEWVIRDALDAPDRATEPEPDLAAERIE